MFSQSPREPLSGTQGHRQPSSGDSADQQMAPCESSGEELTLDFGTFNPGWGRPLLFCTWWSLEAVA